MGAREMTMRRGVHPSLGSGVDDRSANVRLSAGSAYQSAPEIQRFGIVVYCAHRGFPQPLISQRPRMDYEHAVQIGVGAMRGLSL